MNDVECIGQMGLIGSTSKNPHDFPPGTAYGAGGAELPMAETGTGRERATRS